jgi:hypothetical protein
MVTVTNDSDYSECTHYETAKLLLDVSYSKR